MRKWRTLFGEKGVDIHMEQGVRMMGRWDTVHIRQIGKTDTALTSDGDHDIGTWWWQRRT
jgi:hypothetical protein